MDNENKNTVEAVEESDTEKAMQSFLTGANDYEAEAPVDEAPVGMKLGKLEALICALAVFAGAIWTMSNYGAAVICAIAILVTVIVKPGKDAVHCVAANGLFIGAALLVKASLNALGIIFELFMSFTQPESTYSSGYADWVETYNSFTKVMNTVSAIVNIAVFVIFIINVFCLISKKRTFIFGGTAAKLSDKEDDKADEE